MIKKLSLRAKNTIEFRNFISDAAKESFFFLHLKFIIAKMFKQGYNNDEND